jgi:hypothetical protein
MVKEKRLALKARKKTVLIWMWCSIRPIPWLMRILIRNKTPPLKIHIFSAFSADGFFLRDT